MSGKIPLYTSDQKENLKKETAEIDRILEKQKQTIRRRIITRELLKKSKIYIYIFFSTTYCFFIFSLLIQTRIQLNLYVDPSYINTL